jgi:hypothetical protein
MHILLLANNNGRERRSESFGQSMKIIVYVMCLFYVSVISTVVEEGSRISVDDRRSWELNGKLSKGEANMNCSAHWRSRCSTLGVEY